MLNRGLLPEVRKPFLFSKLGKLWQLRLFWKQFWKASSWNLKDSSSLLQSHPYKATKQQVEKVEDLGRAIQCDSPGNGPQDNCEVDNFPLFFLHFLLTPHLAPTENVPSNMKALISFIFISLPELSMCPSAVNRIWDVPERFQPPEYTPFMTP